MAQVATAVGLEFFVCWLGIWTECAVTVGTSDHHKSGTCPGALSLHNMRVYGGEVRQPKYQPADALQSPRFAGIRTFARLPFVEGPLPLEGVDVAVVGLPFDTGATFKNGARFGPESVRSASAILRPYNVELNVTTLGVLSVIDYGDAPVAPGFIEQSYEMMTGTLRPLAEHGILTLGIGGDHSVTLAELRALAAVHGPLSLRLHSLSTKGFLAQLSTSMPSGCDTHDICSVPSFHHPYTWQHLQRAQVHFDSHGDLWDSYFGQKYTHGTPFRRALEEGLILPHSSIQLGMRGPLYGPDDLSLARDLGFTVLTTTQLLQQTPEQVGNLVRPVVGSGRAFLSFDIDFFDPAFAPGTGTPEVGGPSSFQGLQYLRACTGIDWIGGDVVEVLPFLDNGQITAHAAAQVAFEFLSLVALRAEEKKSGIASCQA